MDKLYTPIYDAIKKYLNSHPTAFHMPGHKMGKGLPNEILGNLAQLDLTEIPGTDNLHFPKGAIAEAQKFAAKAFAADETFFLVNGSTAGIHAMIMAVCKPGDKLIVARDCHKSVINGMMLAGVEPVYIKPGFIQAFGIPAAVLPSDVKWSLEANLDAVGVLITRPNYYGICSDIKSIADIVHSHNKLLMVDEAHGAHLKFNNSLPKSAMQSGADVCVQSAHKTLPAFTQGAYLHVKYGKVDIERLKLILGMIQTSSPSYIIMAFLDIARAIMEQNGNELLDKTLGNVEYFKDSLIKNSNISILSNEDIQNGILDKTRVVINVKNLGKTGFQIDKILRKRYNIQVEMADLFNVVCIATVADERKDFENLCEAMHGMSYEFKNNLPLADTYIGDILIPERKMSLKEVLGCRIGKIRLMEAAHKISSGMITPYPPGIPVVCPGEIISEGVIKFIIKIIDSGGIVNGIDDDMKLNVISDMI